MPHVIKYDKKGKLYYRREEEFEITGLFKDCLLGHFLNKEKGLLGYRGDEDVKVFIIDFPKDNYGNVILGKGRKCRIIIETLD